MPKPELLAFVCKSYRCPKSEKNAKGPAATPSS